MVVITEDSEGRVWVHFGRNWHVEIFPSRGHYNVGVTLFDDDGMGLRATSISNHDDYELAVRHGQRLAEILAFVQTGELWERPA